MKAICVLVALAIGAVFAAFGGCSGRQNYDYNLDHGDSPAAWCFHRCAGRGRRRGWRQTWLRHTKQNRNGSRHWPVSFGERV
jgi:hypothetical protein